MSGIADLLQLIEREIPGGRKHLKESHSNLENVASYCEENYMQARDKRHALEETKNYTTQSLASVAYQINTLATNFLHLLDLQMNQLSDMESSVNHISQTVMIHKEKVARREIGVLTTNKTTTRPPGVKNPGIVFPDQPERPVKYVRKAIDYAALDEIGHGIKQAQPQNPVKRRTSSSGAHNITQTGGQAPTTRPPTPPTSGIYTRPAGGTLTRQTSSPYRTPAPPVSPPSLPSHYAPNYPRGTQPPPQPPQQPPQQPPPQQPDPMRTDRRSGYAMGVPPQGPPPAPPPAPPTGTVHPMSHGGGGYSTSQGVALQAQNPPPTPPLPPLPDEAFPMPSRSSVNEPPPPPPPDAPFGIRNSARIGNSSPPLPPPPMHGMDHFAPAPNFEENPNPEYGRNYRGSMGVPSLHEDTTEWKPKEYIERVVAIYDYQKDKDDELSFTEGSTIYVVRKNDDGWWEGVMHGVTGLFPGNYVEPCI